ncbi:MAG: hypothetical protein L0Y44_11710 [Phycisphaerales bacterium]|nr:hypothetical protein [Phycisphaerales bacterium]
MARILMFIYGVIVYAIFFATFVYLFAFFGGYFVPKTVDSGGLVATGSGSQPLWLAVLINLGLVALFGAQHAIMARPAFKEWWTKFVPKPIERSTFVLIASAILILTFWQWRPMPGVIWNIELPAARAVLHICFLAGMGIALLSSFLIDHFDLFGLRQVWLHLRGKPYTQRPFVERSLYKAVRHPLMLGFLISFWCAPTMTAGRLLFAAAMTAYILIGITMEERDLIAQHSEKYLDYRRRTARFFPRLRRRVTAAPQVGVSTAGRLAR